MRGRRIFISSWVLAVCSALAQVPDYFPLEVGNVWIYRSAVANQQPVTVEVTRSESFGGRLYFLLSEYRAGQYWVRNDGAGRVYRFDEKAAREDLWYDFSLAAGESYPTALPTCCGRAMVASTNASKRVALGIFEKAFHQITYPGVFQVGITEEDFLPYVGLVYRAENTGGPSFRTQDLVYARISGVTVLNASGLGFGVARGKDYARIFLNNNTGAALRLVFRSGQTYDLTIRDADGKVLYRWSDGKAFTLALRGVDLPPGETSWPVPLPDVPGAVTLTAELAVVGLPFTSTIPMQSASSSRP